MFEQNVCTPCEQWNPHLYCDPQICIFGAIVMFLMWLFRRVWLWTTMREATEAVTKNIPFVVLSLGVAFDILYGLSHGVVWEQAVRAGLLSGAAAIAMWEAIFKHLMW